MWADALGVWADGLVGGVDFVSLRNGSHANVAIKSRSVWSGSLSFDDSAARVVGMCIRWFEWRWFVASWKRSCVGTGEWSAGGGVDVSSAQCGGVDG